MANGARFGAKEDYLSYLNEVLDSQRDEYKNFVEAISTRQVIINPLCQSGFEWTFGLISNLQMPLKAGFEGHVELGVELAKLQQVLSSVLAQNEDLRRNEQLRDLRNVLDKVKSSLENENEIYIEKPSSSKCPIHYLIIDKSSLLVNVFRFTFANKLLLSLIDAKLTLSTSFIQQFIFGYLIVYHFLFIAMRLHYSSFSFILISILTI